MPTSLGLDAVAKNVYLAMVDQPQADVPKLAACLAESDRAVREALERLSRLSLVAPGDAASGWRPVDPEVGLTAMLARQQADLAHRQLQFEDTRLEVARLLAEHNGRAPGRVPGVDWLSGERAVWARITELAGRCEGELLTLGPAERLSAEQIGCARTVDETLLERGARSRSILLDSARSDPAALEYLRWKTDELGGVRTLPTLPVWMVLADGQVVIPVSTFRSVAGGLVCTAESIVNAFAELFAKLWKEAAPLTQARPRTRGRLSLQEQHILRLWAKGLTDASAARQMDVSLRTVRRLSERLTERFGAHSRFQLGVMAVAEGSLRAEDLM